ncbi:alpha/beta hydrolase family protein [Paenibacillus hexagrammi]|uniref:Dienelactone hydrolase n=1 Tax=Paenibacillus hexagrammi TaxID=2908839 RepID=A0ABY3SLS1_9BACL|nr:alpha/beta hydrolase family protein [Paenibacillus sp. YPD9-1]UJF34164.1 dienelactone hydrolase [Paenibacillus sp. YPD9-1]
MWNPDAYFKQLYTRTAAGSCDSASAALPVQERQAGLRRRLAEALGAEPGNKAPLQPEVLERFEHEDLIVEKLAYSTYEGLRIPAYALYPQQRDGKLPAVLACHGHGPGHRAALGLNADGSFAQPDAAGIHGRFAVQLAKKGMFVLVPEILGFGDRRLQADIEADPVGSQSSCLPISQLLLLCGMTIAGFRMYEAMRALDYMALRPEIDPGRIGAIGFSGGGLVASLTAALDERIRAVVLCGYTNTYLGSILDRPHCMDNYVPGILEIAEQPELIGLIAPRPLFVESGMDDRVFPVGTTEEAIGRLENIYRDWEAGPQLASDLFEGKHEISGRSSFDWLKEKLS